MALLFQPFLIQREREREIEREREKIHTHTLRQGARLKETEGETGKKHDIL